MVTGSMRSATGNRRSPTNKVPVISPGGASPLTATSKNTWSAEVTGPLVGVRMSG